MTRASLAEAASDLAGRDADLARIFRQLGPPPIWSRPAGFTTLVRIILEQQVSLASARAMYRRVNGHMGGLTPARCVETGEAGLRSLGLTRQKSAYCVAAARAVLDGGVALEALRKAGDEEARATLMRLNGIGPWSADIYLLMALRRPDIWPEGDLALAVAVQSLRRLRSRPDARRLVKIAEAWRPYRAVAARMLWQYYLAGCDRASNVRVTTAAASAASTASTASTTRPSSRG